MTKLGETRPSVCPDDMAYALPRASQVVRSMSAMHSRRPGRLGRDSCRDDANGGPELDIA